MCMTDLIDDATHRHEQGRLDQRMVKNMNDSGGKPSLAGKGYTGHNIA